MGFEYALIYMNMSDYTRIAWICQNIPKCGQIYLNMSNVVNMAEHSYLFMLFICTLFYVDIYNKKHKR